MTQLVLDISSICNLYFVLHNNIVQADFIESQYIIVYMYILVLYNISCFALATLHVLYSQQALEQYRVPRCSLALHKHAQSSSSVHNAQVLTASDKWVHWKQYSTHNALATCIGYCTMYNTYGFSQVRLNANMSTLREMLLVELNSTMYFVIDSFLLKIQNVFFFILHNK